LSERKLNIIFAKKRLPMVMWIDVGVNWSIFKKIAYIDMISYTIEEVYALNISEALKWGATESPDSIACG
jgi:hypothetical protein